MEYGKIEEKSQENSAYLTSMDLARLDEMDPSLADGYKVAYDREVPFELRLQDAQQEVGTLESIRCKVLVLSDGPQLQSIKIELSSESDLFFHYTSIVDEDNFIKMKEDQKLNTDLAGYFNIVIKMFNLCQKEPHTYFAVFFMQRDGGARLDIIQNMEYKFIELLSVDFHVSPEDIIRQTITFRYNTLKAKLLFMQSKLKDICQLIKVKNPSLLIQLQKMYRTGGSGETKSVTGSKYLTSSGNKTQTQSKFLK